MVQWFCLISWRLFDGLMLYWRYWFNVTQTLNWNYTYWPVTYISWSNDFALYLEDYLMDKCHNWNMDPCDGKINHIKCMWVSDLHFMVYWFWYILKTFWWKNVGLKILIQCDIKFDLHLYFVVQWFCLIFSILFDEQASFFGYWSWYGPLKCISW